MEIRSVSVGVVAIKSVSNGLYLAMSKKGTLFGSVRIQLEWHCSWRSSRGGWELKEKVWEAGRYRGPKHLPIQTCLILQTGWKMSGILFWKVQKRSECYNQSWRDTWSVIPAASVGSFHCQNRWKRRETQPAATKKQLASFKNPCMPSAKCCFTSRLLKVITSFCESQTHIRPEGCRV